MNEILNKTSEKIENNQYYLDNFEFLVDKYKTVTEALTYFSRDKGELAVKELYKVSRIDLITTYVYFARFWDSKEEHEKEIELIDYLMHDGNNLEAKIKKFEFIDSICILKFGEKHGVLSEDDEVKLERLKQAFKNVYGEEYYESLLKLLENDQFLLMFNATFNYMDILNHDYSKEKTVLIIELLRHSRNSDAFNGYIEDEKIRVNYSILNFDSLFGYICDQIDIYRKEIRGLRKENTKLVTKVQKLKKIVNKKDDEMISTRELGDLLEEEDSIKLLKSILESNSKVALKVEENFGIKEKLFYLLYSYHYSLDDVMIDDLSSVNIDILKNNLEELKNSCISLSNTNLEYIIKSNILIEKDKLKSLVSRGFINSTVVNKNIRLLTEENEFNNFSKNISLFENNGINIVDIVNGYYEFLFINNSYLEEVLKLSSLYGIKLDNDKLIRLIDVTNFDNIDLYIEEGYHDFIVNNINLLEQGDLIPKRIHINNLVNSELVDSNSISSELVNEGSFFVPNSSLDSACGSKIYVVENKEIKHILDNSNRLSISNDTMCSDVVLKLDREYRDNDVYSFDGIIISRNKVLRNLEVLKNTNYSLYDIVLNSIIYNSILGVDDIKTITSEIKNTFGMAVVLK